MHIFLNMAQIKKWDYVHATKKKNFSDDDNLVDREYSIINGIRGNGSG